MSNTPPMGAAEISAREISPELVLVDRELAEIARRNLPDPGYLAPRPPLDTPTIEHAAHAVPGAETTCVAGEVGPPSLGRAWPSLALAVGAVALILATIPLVKTLVPQIRPSASAEQLQLPRDETIAAREATELPGLTPPAVLEPPRRARPVTAPKRPRARAFARPSETSARTTHTATRSRESAKPPSTRRASAKPLPAVPARRIVLTWDRVPGAAYYDVVIWGSGRRVLDLWPTQPRVRLSSAPAANERVLEPGSYLWFVYPGYGNRTQRRFGPLATHGTFTIAPRKVRHP